jgi:hypothetical protein
MWLVGVCGGFRQQDVNKEIAMCSSIAYRARFLRLTCCYKLIGC